LKLDIKHIQPEDWKGIARIYNLGIETGIATFETEIPSWQQWNVSHLESCRIGAWLENQIVCWVALSPVSNRSVYRGVAEVSVYVDLNFNKKGIGTQLLQSVILESESEEIWTLQASVFRENKASIDLHKKVGFREIGYREKVGKRKSVWHDNVLLERRSKTIGIN